MLSRVFDYLLLTRTRFSALFSVTQLVPLCLTGKKTFRFDMSLVSPFYSLFCFICVCFSLFFICCCCCFLYIITDFRCNSEPTQWRIFLCISKLRYHKSRMDNQIICGCFFYVFFVLFFLFVCLFVFLLSVVIVSCLNLALNFCAS